MTWRDIETAPKDGTVFLAINAVGQYSLAQCDQTVWRTFASEVLITGHDAEWGSQWEGKSDFTHWMPLPDPPA